MHTNSLTVTEADRFIHGPGFSDVLEQLAMDHPGRVYLRDRNRPWTVAELNHRVDSAVEQLRWRGVEADSRVVLAQDNSLDQIAMIFALLRIGALWIPVNTQVKGEPLRHQLRDSRAELIVADAEGPLVAHLVGSNEGELDTFVCGDDGGPAFVAIKAEKILDHTGVSQMAVTGTHLHDESCLLMYTSGTTGPPKGALVSEAMLKAAVLGALDVTDPRAGDVFYVWEPLFHIGGAQVVFLPLYSEITLALVPRFSATRFWNDIATFGVTHLHYLGGILQILLQLPPVPEESANRVRMAWGAGATPEVRSACRDRFGFALHECYGMTETSSIVTVNRDRSDGGVGYPLPWVDVDIRSVEQKPGTDGEIRIRGKVEGLLTNGYFGNEEASAKARDGEWFLTGDIGHLDEDGNLHFVGRGSDSIRVRGENVSTWQIENVFGLHPDVERCTIVGVEAQIGEQEMMLLVTEAAGRTIVPLQILEWSQGQLAKFQIPRYVKVIPEMPLTPSQRIAKHRLSRSVDDAVDSSAPPQRWKN